MMKTVKLFLILISFVCLCGRAIAEERPTIPILTLKEALEIAREHDVRLILSKERVNQALAHIGESRSTLLPQIDLTSSQSRLTRDLRSSGINLSGDPLVGPINTFDARAKLTQTLFDPAALARLKAAQAGANSSAADFQKTKEDVLALVATLYINARRATESVEFAQTLLKHKEKNLELSKSRLESGIASELELKQAQAAYEAARHYFQHAVNEAAQTRLDLLAALDFNFKNPLQLSEDDGIEFPIPGEEISTNLESLPAVKSAQEQVHAAVANRAAERSEYLPKISALADYGASGVDPSDANSTYTVGFKASMPIFEGGLRESLVKERDSEVRSSEASLRDTKNQAEADVLKARESFSEAQALVTEKTAARAVLFHQVVLVQARLQNGTASDLELLEILAEEARAHEEENEACATLLTAQINWVHALGGMETLLEKTKDVAQKTTKE